MGFWSDVKRHFEMVKHEKEGTLPRSSGRMVGLPDYWEVPDSYNLPKDVYWLIEGKWYSNAGEAKAAAEEALERSGNNY